jgi:hypothetical protein
MLLLVLLTLSSIVVVVSASCKGAEVSKMGNVRPDVAVLIISLSPASTFAPPSSLS